MADINTWVQDPQWRAETGEQDEKSVFAEKSLRGVAVQLTVALLMAFAGLKSKKVDKVLISPLLLFFAVGLTAGGGFALLLHKHLRVDYTKSLALLIGFSAGLSTSIACLLAMTSYSHFFMILFLAGVLGVDCLWFSLQRNKRAETIQKNMVVGTIMAMLVTLLIVAVYEHNSESIGQIGAATFLCISLSITLITCFYVTFYMVKIALVEAEDFEDWIPASIHVYLDILKAIWMLILRGVEKLSA